MLDDITGIFTVLLQFLSSVDSARYLPEAGAIGAIFILIFLFVIIRKRRKRKSASPAPAQPETAATPKDDAQELLDDQMEYDEGDDWKIDEAPPADQGFSAKGFDQPGTDKQFQGRKSKTEPLPFAEPEVPADVTPPPEPTVTDRKEDAAGFLGRLKSGLSKTRESLSKRFDTILSGNRKIDAGVLEEVEEALITSDIGVSTTMALMQRIEKNAGRISGVDGFKALLKQEMRALVDIEAPVPPSEKPRVIMVIGVNGVGKTTTIGKLAAKFSAQGQKVLLAAADTFRAAAAEQLEIWAQRSHAEIVRHRDKSDPAAVAFDSIEAAMAREIDVVIVDTAGRLHTKVNLMEELKKIKRSINKKMPSAPHETLLVLDATTGQNAVSQAKLFNENIPLSGIILTKLDGTAKGGIVVSICDALKVPIRYIGIGESIDDLQEFNAELFVNALF